MATPRSSFPSTPFPLHGGLSVSRTPLLIGLMVIVSLATGCAQPDGGTAGNKAGVPTGTAAPAADETAVTRSATATAIAVRVATDGLPPRGQCGRLNAFYQQRMEAPNPLDLARRAGLRILDGRVEARIGIASDSAAAEAELVQRYGLRVESRVQTVIEGFVPVSNLCDFGKDPLVTSVGYPSRPKVGG